MANSFNMEKRCFDNINKRESGSDSKTTDNGHQLKEERFRLTCKDELFPYEVGPALQQVVLKGCSVSIPGFQDSTAQSFEQFDLTSYLTLLWAGGKSRDFLRSSPTWIILWSNPININFSSFICLALIEMARNGGFGAKVSRPNAWK